LLFVWLLVFFLVSLLFIYFLLFDSVFSLVES
jgi:hypothetical protein